MCRARGTWHVKLTLSSFLKIVSVSLFRMLLLVQMAPGMGKYSVFELTLRSSLKMVSVSALRLLRSILCCQYFCTAVVRGLPHPRLKDRSHFLLLSDDYTYFAIPSEKTKWFCMRLFNLPGWSSFLWKEIRHLLWTLSIRHQLQVLPRIETDGQNNIYSRHKTAHL